MAMSYGFLNRLRKALGTKQEDGLTSILADLAVGHPDDRLDTLDPMHAHVGKPVNMDGEEQLEYGWYLTRGQKLVRQEDWSKLGQEIRQFDEMRATTSGGSPISEILTLGARYDVVRPLEVALRFREPEPSTEGIAEFHEVMREHPNDHGVAAILAYTHIDAGWAWYNAMPSENHASYLRVFQEHFAIAQEVLNNFNAQALSSPLLAAAQCATLPGLKNADLRVVEDYNELIELDPTTPLHFRNFGRHLLPQFLGDYATLETEAVKMRDKMRDIWGTGAYAWMYMDALTEDQNAFQMMDVDAFLHAILEIFERRPDQFTANEIAAFLCVTMGDYSGRQETASLRKKRQKLNEAAEYVVEAFLREINPMPWYNAIINIAPHVGIEDQEVQQKMGEETALRMLCKSHLGLAQAANL